MSRSHAEDEYYRVARLIENLSEAEKILQAVERYRRQGSRHTTPEMLVTSMLTNFLNKLPPEVVTLSFDESGWVVNREPKDICKIPLNERKTFRREDVERYIENLASQLPLKERFLRTLRQTIRR